MSTGDQMLELVRDLYPICRSITGDGLRESLRLIGGLIPLELHEVASGTQVFDWTIPAEWNVSEAWVEDPAGRRVIDIERSNLHLVGYSRPVQARLPLAALRSHLHSLPDRPDWIPYRTTYYDDDWGFCLRHRELEALQDGEYEVRVDTMLSQGSLTYGECVLTGEGDGVVLVSAHSCHPSLANDNLSGMVVAAFLARALQARRRRLTYRFVFAPGTIGALAWLHANLDDLGTIEHGLVVTGVGDPGTPTYKRSRRGDAVVDRAMAAVLDGRGPHTVQPFSPFGYDERQYCSPGFDLPVGCLMRTPPGSYPEYHTSADDLAFIRGDSLRDTLEILLALVDVLEGNVILVRTNPHGEPQLGRRGLHPLPDTEPDAAAVQTAMAWVLNLSDGRHDLLSIAKHGGLPFAPVRRAATLLLEHDLVRLWEAA